MDAGQRDQCAPGRVPLPARQAEDLPSRHTLGGINPIARYAGGGLVYTGLLRPEGDDRIGVTIARAEFSRPYRRRTGLDGGLADLAETVLELTYRTPLNKWLTLQPDLQYVRNRSANPALGDALAIGVRFEVGL